MILQNNSCKTEAKVSLKAQTLHTLFDDTAKNSCKSYKQKSLSKTVYLMIMQKLMQRTEAKVSLKTVYLMMMQEIQAKAESKSLSKQKLTHFTKLHFHLY